jgi:hypothetical protein
MWRRLPDFADVDIWICSEERTARFRAQPIDELPPTCVAKADITFAGVMIASTCWEDASDRLN